MKPVVIIGISVGLSVVAVIGVLIAWNTIQQQEAEREIMQMQQERQQQLEADIMAYEQEQRNIQSRAESRRDLENAKCRELFTFHGDLKRLERCIDAVEADMWYWQQGREPPRDMSFCDDFPSGSLAYIQAGCP